MIPLTNKNGFGINTILALAALALLLAGCGEGDGDYDSLPPETPDGTPETGNPAKDKKPDIEKIRPDKPLSIEEKLAQIDFAAAPTLGETARRYYRILLERDWSAMWEMLSEKARQSYEDRERWNDFDIDPEELRSIATPREYYILLMQRTMPQIERLDAIQGEEIEPDNNSGWLLGGIGRLYEFVREDGQWKLSLQTD